MWFTYCEKIVQHIFYKNIYNFTLIIKNLSFVGVITLDIINK